MLSRNLKRALLDSRWPLPPAFLLPWAANLSTASQPIDTGNIPPPPPMQSKTHIRRVPSKQSFGSILRMTSKPVPSQKRLVRPKDSSEADRQSNAQSEQPAIPPPNSQLSPLALSPSISELLPLLTAQESHYITLHIHGKPYLVTQGDTIRLPFFMHGVEPGDILRMNRAINIGSRDYTMKASAAAPKLRSSTMRSIQVVDPTTGSLTSKSMVMPSTVPPAHLDAGVAEVVAAAQPGVVRAPHFIPHLEKGKHSYLDERLYVCRAVVMGMESEPLRIMEKTKRRNRKVKRVKDKMRFTVLKIKEVRVKRLEELDGEDGVAEVE